MKLDQFKFVLSLFLLVFIFSLPWSFVFAEERGLETNYPGIGEQEGLSDDATLSDLAVYVFNFSLILAGISAFASLIYGGFIYLTSAGSPAKQNDAKSWIFGGIFGLILILSSFLILKKINPEFLKLTSPELSNPELGPYPDASLTDGRKIIDQETPIGTLVENLLAKNIDCYNYNSEGDMADPPAGCPCAGGGGGSDGEDGEGVAMMKDHDRLDCIKKLAEAVETKDKKLKEFSEELKSEVDKCNCSRCSCGSSCSGDPCPNRGRIDELREEIKKIITGEGVTDPNFLYIREGVRRLKEMRTELQKDRDNLIEAEYLLKYTSEYESILSLAKFFDMKQGRDDVEKIKFKDLDMREYCIEFNCIEWEHPDELDKRFCIKYELNDKGRLCGATTTETIVEATGKKDIDEYFVLDGDPATFDIDEYFVLDGDPATFYFIPEK